MDSSDAIQFVILIVLLILSAFFSSAETALTTVSKIRMRSLADDGNKRARMVLDVTEKHSRKMLSAILIGNNIVNISASSLAATLAYSFGGYMVSIATAILTSRDPRIRRDYSKEHSNLKCSEAVSCLYPGDPGIYGGDDPIYLHH